MGMLVEQRVRMNLKMALMLVVTIGVLLTGVYSLAVGAVDAGGNSDAANTFKASPVRTDIEIKPGESKTVKTTVTNLTDEPIKISPITNDFIAGDERGTPSLILDEKQFAPTHSLKRFMEPLDDVTIPADSSVAINVVINVPDGAQAGGYFGAIRFAPAKPDGGGQVNLSPSVASLILMTVPGDIVETLNLTNFDIQKDGKTGAYFNNSEGVNASVRFENKGNVQVGPFGKVSVKKGDDVVYEVDFNDNDPRDMILPDSARRWDIPLDKISGFGQYTVSATFTYGAKNQTVEVSKSFWIIPMSIIIAAGVGLLVLVGLIIGIRMFLKRYKRRVLRSSGGGGLRRL